MNRGSCAFDDLDILHDEEVAHLFSSGHQGYLDAVEAWSHVVEGEPEVATQCGRSCYGAVPVIHQSEVDLVQNEVITNDRVVGAINGKVHRDRAGVRA